MRGNLLLRSPSPLRSSHTATKGVNRRKIVQEKKSQKIIGAIPFLCVLAQILSFSPRKYVKIRGPTLRGHIEKLPILFGFAFFRKKMFYLNLNIFSAKSDFRSF